MAEWAVAESEEGALLNSSCDSFSRETDAQSVSSASVALKEVEADVQSMFF